MHVLWPRCSIRKRRAQLDVSAPHIANDEPNTFSHSGHFIGSHDGNPSIGGGRIFTVSIGQNTNPYLV